MAIDNENFAFEPSRWASHACSRFFETSWGKDDECAVCGWLFREHGGQKTAHEADCCVRLVVKDEPFVLEGELVTDSTSKPGNGATVIETNDLTTKDLLEILVEAVQQLGEQQEELIIKLEELNERVANISTPGVDFSESEYE